MRHPCSQGGGGGGGGGAKQRCIAGRMLCGEVRGGKGGGNGGGGRSRGQGGDISDASRVLLEGGPDEAPDVKRGVGRRRDRGALPDAEPWAAAAATSASREAPNWRWRWTPSRHIKAPALGHWAVRRKPKGCLTWKPLKSRLQRASRERISLCWAGQCDQPGCESLAPMPLSICFLFTTVAGRRRHAVSCRKPRRPRSSGGGSDVQNQARHDAQA